MLSWFISNIGNIIVCLLLAFIVYAVIRSMIKDKKSGKSPICGGKCGHCGMGCCCGKNKQKQ